MKKLLMMVAVGCLVAGTAAAATHTVHPGGLGDFLTISAAVTAADPADTILVQTVGPYPEKVVVNKQLTIEGDGSYPVVNPALSPGEYVFAINAANVTVRGLDIKTSTELVCEALGVGSDARGFFDSYGGQYTGTIIADCKIHDLNFGIDLYANNVTVSNCDFYGLISRGVWLHGGSYLIRGNSFYDWATSDKCAWKYPYGIVIEHSSRKGGGEMSYNYFDEVDTAIQFFYAVNGEPSSLLEIKHNTFASSATNAAILQYQGVGFWECDEWSPCDETSGWAGDNIVFKDNIFFHIQTRGIREIGTVDAGCPITGSMTVQNNLFYHNNWILYHSGTQTWYGDHDPANWGAQVRWESDAEDFTFTDNLSDDETHDPLFVGSGSTPEEFFALQESSPARGAASDGTDIGAWQSGGGGGPQPPSGTGAVFLFK